MNPKEEDPDLGSWTPRWEGETERTTAGGGGGGRGSGGGENTGIKRKWEGLGSDPTAGKIRGIAESGDPLGTQHQPRLPSL